MPLALTSLFFAFKRLPFLFAHLRSRQASAVAKTESAKVLPCVVECVRLARCDNLTTQDCQLAIFLIAITNKQQLHSTHTLVELKAVHKGRAQQRILRDKKGHEPRAISIERQRFAAGAWRHAFWPFQNWCEAFAGAGWGRVKRARLFSFSLACIPYVSKECVTPAEKNYYQTLMAAAFQGEQQLRAANAHIYKKNTQDPAQGIILHAAGLSRLYTYHLWLVVRGYFYTGVAAKYTKNIFHPDFVLVSVRFHACDREAFFVSSYCNLIHTCSHSGVTRSWQTTR